MLESTEKHVAEQLGNLLSASNALGLELLQKESRTEVEDTFCRELAQITVLLMLTQAVGEAKPH
ncbi:MAG: hypothetical protein ACQEXV_23950 [Bacillota bacterium]